MARKLTGEELATITREIVRIKSQTTGKGATEAKSYQCDSFVFCVLRGGMTTMEQSLIEDGDEALVRDVRLAHQRNRRESFSEAVEQVAGARVLTYQSQVLFDPDYTVEIFVLDDPPFVQAGP